MNSSATFRAVKLSPWIPVGLMVAAMALIWWNSVGNPLIGGRHFEPAGQQFYLLSKIAGLTGIVLLAFQALYAIWKPLLPDHLRISRVGHIYLGVLVVVTILLHVTLFFVAAWIRQQHFPVALLIPDFGHGFYKSGLSLGLIGLWGMLLVLYLGMALASRPGKQLKRLHTLAMLMMVPAFVHGAMIGTEAEHPVVQVFGLAFVLLCMLGAANRVTHR